MPAAFDTMRELLNTIDDALPSNTFLRKWPRSRVGKYEENGGRERGGRGEGRCQFGRNSGRPLRNRELEVEDLSLDDLGDIEIASQAYEEGLLVNHVVEMDDGGFDCNEHIPKVLQAPSFRKHGVHAKKSIHIPVRIQNMTSTTLIDCGATNNFINLAFIDKRELEPIPL